MINLDDLTFDLGKAYDEYKASEKRFAGEDKKKKDRKPGLKEAFFDAVTEVVAKTTLAQKTVVAPNGVDPESYALKRNPRWRILKILDGGRVVLQEDPRYKPFTYVNRKTKRVWTRSVKDGAPYLDDEELRERDPELWKRVTRVANHDFILEVIKSCRYRWQNPIVALPNDKEQDRNLVVFEKLADRFEVERDLLPLEELSPEDLSGLQEYMYPGKPIVSLSAPRDAKPEELNEDDN